MQDTAPEDVRPYTTIFHQGEHHYVTAVQSDHDTHSGELLRLVALSPVARDNGHERGGWLTVFPPAGQCTGVVLTGRPGRHGEAGHGPCPGRLDSDGACPNAARHHPHGCAEDAPAG